MTVVHPVVVQPLADVVDDDGAAGDAVAVAFV